MAVSHVSRERRQPASTEQAAGVAHRILAVHAGPIRERCAGNDQWTDELRIKGCQHHHRPPALAIADDTGFAIGLRVQLDHALQKLRLSAGYVFNCLPRHWLRQESD
jgi:hypothetical protein